MNIEQLTVDPSINSASKAVDFKIPTLIQLKAIPSVLEGLDALSLAQNVTSKTARTL